MIYLAPPNTQQVRQAIGAGKLGAMLTPKSWSGLNEEASRGFPFIGLDNGCFSDSWNENEWGSWLIRMQPLVPQVLFAVVPDVVADHAATLELWKQNFAQVHTFGYPAAFVLQDGATYKDVPWSELDVLFIGGSTAYKLAEQTWRIIERAASNGVWVHMGRVNTFNRLRRAAAHGVSSVDGTTLAIAPDTNLPVLLSWLDWLNHNQVLV